MPGQQGEPVSRAESVGLDVKGSRRRRSEGGSEDGGERREQEQSCKSVTAEETLLFTEKYYHTQLANPCASRPGCEDIYFSQRAYTFIRV